jgi:hypothetical protein
MDEEQLQLGTGEEFWQLIATRRSQRTISRAELELRLSAESQPKDGIHKGNVHNNP